MTTYRKLVPALAAALVACSPALALAQDQAMAHEDAETAVHVSSGSAEFTEVAAGVETKVLWGDRDSGPYGAFTRFAPGIEHSRHAHSNEIRLVVIEGAYVYTPENGDVIRVGPGEYLSVPGGTVHVSGGDAAKGALFYESSAGGFDMNLLDE